VGFEHAIPASEQAKTVHALDRSATVTGKGYIITLKILVPEFLRLKLYRVALTFLASPRLLLMVFPEDDN
jgi:hypothetical protein